MSQKKNIDTQLAHLGTSPYDNHGLVNPPVYHGSTVLFESYEAFCASGRELLNPHNTTYGRFGTPTSHAFCEAINQLEGGFATYLASSGAGILSTCMQAAVKAGDHVLVIDNAYSHTRRFASNVLARFAVEVEYYDPTIGADIAKLIKPNTRLIMLESPGTWTFEMQDIPAITEVAKQHDIVTIIDNTWASPYFYQPLQHGVDISLHAATKYIVGHSDAMMGVATVNERCFELLREGVHDSGHSAAPDDVYLALRGLRTLSVRLERHQENAMVVAKWLQQHQQVKRVLYPALPEDPGYAIWQRDFSGASGLFSVQFKNFTREQAIALIDASQLFGIGASWGGYESLALLVEPQKMRTATQWLDHDPIVRLHVGLENPSDLIADLEQAFAVANRLG